MDNNETKAIINKQQLPPAASTTPSSNLLEEPTSPITLDHEYEPSESSDDEHKKVMPKNEASAAPPPPPSLAEVRARRRLRARNDDKNELVATLTRSTAGPQRGVGRSKSSASPRCSTTPQALAGNRRSIPKRSYSQHAPSTSSVGLASQMDAVPKPPLERALSAKLVVHDVMEFFGQDTAGWLDDDDDDSQQQQEEDEDNFDDYKIREHDIQSLVHDTDEFRRLKSALQAKGAVTNEMLRQRLHVYVRKNRHRWNDKAMHIVADTSIRSGFEGREEERHLNLNAHNDDHCD